MNLVASSEVWPMTSNPFSVAGKMALITGGSLGDRLLAKAAAALSQVGGIWEPPQAARIPRADCRILRTTLMSR